MVAFAYTADSSPSTFEAEQSKGADVFIHEIFPSAEEFAEGNSMPIEYGRNVLGEHTQGAELGAVFDIARPRLGVGSHFTMDDELIDPLFQRWRTTYDGPVLLAQDLTTINVTAAQIVVRQIMADLLSWPPPPVDRGADMTIGPPSDARRPDWLTDTRLQLEP